MHVERHAPTRATSGRSTRDAARQSRRSQSRHRAPRSVRCCRRERASRLLVSRCRLVLNGAARLPVRRPAAMPLPSESIRTWPLRSKSTPTRPSSSACRPTAAPPSTWARSYTACPKCGSLLDVAYDWDRTPPPDSLRWFEQKWARRNEPLCRSGVWRFRELLPFAPPEQDRHHRRRPNAAACRPTASASTSA